MKLSQFAEDCKKVFFYSLKISQQEIIRLGGEVELVDLGPQQGKNIHLPPALLGTLGKDSAKKTVGQNMI